MPRITLTELILCTACSALFFFGQTVARIEYWVWDGEVLSEQTYFGWPVRAYHFIELPRNYGNTQYDTQYSPTGFVLSLIHI